MCSANFVTATRTVTNAASHIDNHECMIRYTLFKQTQSGPDFMRLSLWVSVRLLCLRVSLFAHSVIPVPARHKNWGSRSGFCGAMMHSEFLEDPISSGRCSQLRTWSVAVVKGDNAWQVPSNRGFMQISALVNHVGHSRHDWQPSTALSHIFFLTWFFELGRKILTENPFMMG